VEDGGDGELVGGQRGDEIERQPGIPAEQRVLAPRGVDDDEPPPVGDTEPRPV